MSFPLQSSFFQPKSGVKRWNWVNFSHFEILNFTSRRLCVTICSVQISGWKYGHFETQTTKTNILTFLENKRLFARTTYIRLLIYLKALYGQKNEGNRIFNSCHSMVDISWPSLLKSQFRWVLFAYNLMIGCAKKIEKIIWESAFDKKKKKHRLKFNPGLVLTSIRTTGPWSVSFDWAKFLIFPLI